MIEGYGVNLNEKTENREFHLLICLGHNLESLKSLKSLQKENSLVFFEYFIKKTIKIKFVELIKIISGCL